MTDPDPCAPQCACCQNNRRPIRELGRRLNAVSVGQGVLWDAQGRKHQHFGVAGGFASYECECGHRWEAAFPNTLYPCWCNWPQST